MEIRPLRGSAVAAAAALAACAGSPQAYDDLRRDYDRLPYPEAADAPPASDPFAGAEALERAPLVEAVLERNPSIEAARQAWIQATEEVPAERSLSDPMLQYSIAPLSAIDDDARFGHSVRLSQRLPWPGVRGARGDVAVARAEALQGDYLSARLELALAAATLYDEYYRVARELEINETHIELLADAQAGARAEFEAGRATLQDPLQAEVEASHLEHRRLALRGEHDEIVARLNALLHRDHRTPLPPAPEARDIPEPIAAPAEALIALALAERTELDSAEAEIRAGEAALDLAGAEDRPQFGVSAMYDSMWPGLSHQIMVGLEMSLPIWRERRRGDRDAARAQRERARAEHDHLATEIAADVVALHRRATETLHVVVHYQNEIIPAAEDRAEAAHAAFVAGDLSFNALVDALTRLRDQELEYEQHLAELYTRRAALARSVGRVPGELDDIAGGAIQEAP